MVFAEGRSKDPLVTTKRRAPRMNCRVPVTIEWSGKPQPLHFETGFTRVVNAYGCLLVSSMEMNVPQRLRVTNLVTQQAADGVVVWKGTERPDGWDLGVELVGADLNFWGVEF
ncbi:MAG TPA: hypothetical protein VNE63_19540 [Candidatus Acidoferrales bacterium]|nr:hypothetical protein [Candidatus Acidoferrales bacterium]